MGWERKQGLECEECNARFVKGEFDEESIYQCGNCGTKFTRGNSADGSSHKCPDCNKFASKLQDFTGIACTECEAGELMPYDGVECVLCANGGTEVVVLPEDDLAEHLKDEHADDLAEYYIEHAVGEPLNT